MTPTWQSIFARFTGYCAMCGRPVEKLEIVRNNQYWEYFAVATCHGQTESLPIDILRDVKATFFRAAANEDAAAKAQSRAEKRESELLLY